MAQPTGRLTCPRCGANNFDTVSVCWKCAAPLAAAPSMQPIRMDSPAQPPIAIERPVSAYAPAPIYPPASPPYMPGVGSGDPGVARRAAILLALTLPWIGLPVGWVFMMIEDSRKQAVGRVCAAWSMIALVFHLLLMFVAAQSLGGMLKMALDVVAKSAAQGSSRDSGSGAP